MVMNGLAWAEEAYTAGFSAVKATRCREQLTVSIVTCTMRSLHLGDNLTDTRKNTDVSRP